MRLADRLLEHPLVYRLWMAPFAEKKLAPVLAWNDASRVRRVLDVGCGPGTNAHHFADTHYRGVDLNPRYIEYARRRHRGEFLTADVTSEAFEDGGYDFILVNSLLHHIDDDGVHRLLACLADLLADDGHVHVIELILPEERSIARRFTLWDRGHYARPIEVWRAIFECHFQVAAFHPFAVGLGGVTLWQMVYFKGRPGRA